MSRKKTTTKSAPRQRTYREGMKKKGFVEINLWVPQAKVSDFRELATRARDGWRSGDSDHPQNLLVAPEEACDVNGD